MTEEKVVACNPQKKKGRKGAEKIHIEFADAAICPTWHAQEQRIEVDDS